MAPTRTVKSSALMKPVPSSNPDLIDDAVLALLWLTAMTERPGTEFARTWAWKGHDWDALNRLYQKGLIWDPVGKQKSVVLTQEGVSRSQELFEAMFCGKPPSAITAKTRHRFTPAAARKWENVPAMVKPLILGNVWCGHCRKARTIEEFTGMEENGQVVLRGFCAECGHVIARVLEESECSGHQSLS